MICSAYVIFFSAGGAVRIAGGRDQRQLYNAHKLPGHAAALRRDPSPSTSSKSPGNANFAYYSHFLFFIHLFKYQLTQ